jgi:glutamine synthetase
MSDSDERIRLLFTDVLGLSHGKVVRESHRDNPTHYAITVMIQGLDLEFDDIANYSVGDGFPDMEARLDPTTVRPSWDTGLLAMTNLHFSDGRPLPLCARTRLAEQVAKWRTLGLDPMIGFEMEFFLSDDPTLKSGPLEVPMHRVYGTGPGADPSGLLDAIHDAGHRAHLDIEGVNGEFHPGQVEASLRYRDALTASDAAFLFRDMVREIALARGMGATFMARPFDGLVGNGMHLNMSANDSTGANVFADASAPDGISQLCRHAIAGLIEHHTALSALFAPTINSYKRLRPGMLAGYYATWGLDNRLTSIRIPGQRGNATRIEHRTPDGTASPHLATLGLLAAALDGIERKLEPSAPSAGNAEENAGDVACVAGNLGEALAALESDKVLVDALGEDLTNVFTTIKRAEIARWEQAVTDWEVTTYGRVY